MKIFTGGRSIALTLGLSFVFSCADKESGQQASQLDLKTMSAHRGVFDVEKCPGADFASFARYNGTEVGHNSGSGVQKIDYESGFRLRSMIFGDQEVLISRKPGSVKNQWVLEASPDSEDLFTVGNHEELEKGFFRYHKQFDKISSSVREMVINPGQINEYIYEVGLCQYHLPLGKKFEMQFQLPSNSHQVWEKYQVLLDEGEEPLDIGFRTRDLEQRGDR